MPLPNRMLELTLAAPCDVRCSYCPQDTLVEAYKGDRFMPPITFAAILHNTPRDVLISFAGFCEPTQNPHWLPYVSAAIGLGFQCNINTTCRYMTKEGARCLNAVKNLTVSVHVTEHVTPEQQAAIDILHAERKGPVVNRVSRAGNLWKPDAHYGPIECSRTKSYSHPVVMPNGAAYLCCCDYGLRHYVGNLIIQGFDSLDAGEVASSNSLHCGNTICRQCEWSAPIRKGGK